MQGCLTLRTSARDDELRSLRDRKDFFFFFQKGGVELDGE